MGAFRSRGFLWIFFIFFLCVKIHAAPAPTGEVDKMVVDFFFHQATHDQYFLHDTTSQQSFHLKFESLCSPSLKSAQKIKLIQFQIKDQEIHLPLSEECSEQEKNRTKLKNTSALSLLNFLPPPPTGKSYPLSALPLLSSAPDFDLTLFLDFDGVPEIKWGLRAFPYSIPPTPPFDVDGIPSFFNEEELRRIKNIWARIVEKFSTLPVNVTTQDPGQYPKGNIIRVGIGGKGEWYHSLAGGTGWVNGLTRLTVENGNTVWVFSDNLKGDEKFVAEAVAHEIGHALGLEHQNLYAENGDLLDEYHPGTPKKAPIMGFSYGAERGTWWEGTSGSPRHIQNDIELITQERNNISLLEDDVPDEKATALSLPLNDSLFTHSGVITSNEDVDIFSVQVQSGYLYVDSQVASMGPMLDVELDIYNQYGNRQFQGQSAFLGEKVLWTC